MNAGEEDLGALLRTAYVVQAEQYTTALRLTGELAAACRRGEAIEDRLAGVLHLLCEIAKRDAALVPTKQRWEQAGKAGKVALQDTMHRIVGLIEQIRGDLQVIEEAVRARRDRLAVELDVCNRQFRMQRAYQRES